MTDVDVMRKEDEAKSESMVITIGLALNAKTQTFHSEMNAIAVENQGLRKVVGISPVGTSGMNDTKVEMPRMDQMIGPVRNVTTRTLLSGKNAIDVERKREVVPKSGVLLGQKELGISGMDIT